MFQCFRHRKNTSKSTANEPESIDFFAMDTTIKFSAYGDKKVLKGAKKVLTDFEKKVSVTDSGSEIYHINQNVHTYRFLYTERFFRAAFQFLHTFHGFRPYTKAQLLFALLSETFLTMRQNSLNVTVCMIARSSCRGYFIHSLSTLYYYNAPSLATRLTGDYRNRTFTGKCGPASLDTRYNKKKHLYPTPNASFSAI